jgi:predicted enzyme related to lactoylglutathione lyase
VDPGEEETGVFFASIGRTDPQPEQPTMMFIKVPEPKSVKNRVHLDLDASDREAEVERLVGLGATVVHDKDEWGVRWTTLTDPEGNEFCVATH